MRKVIGIGETILDVIFRDGQPSHAVPGGSVFNGLVSLSRTGVPVCFISELGQDRVGGLILEFMRRNGMDTRYMDVYPGAKSPVSLAFLNEDNDADYTFYKDFPVRRPDADYPEIAEDDIVVIGSFYALDPATRGKVTGLLELARERKAIVYYDPNFRAPHKEEALRLAPTIIENLEYADIVRGSREDFHYMYGLDDADKVYADKIQFYCPTFLYSTGGGRVSLRTATVRKDYDVPQVKTVSTIGAGDNFNAGIIYGLLANGVRRDTLATADEATWDKILQCGMAFAREVCQSTDNYVPSQFATQFNYREPLAE